MRNFDPRKIAHYEKENYVAYYQRDWLKLVRVSIGLVKETFGLNWLQATYAAYLVARAEIAFAPFPHNDVPCAKNFMRRFYAFIKQIHHADFDIDRATELELNWWIAHRNLFGNPQNQGLVDALADLYAEAYRVERHQVLEAARQRALGMLYSDYWVNQGKPAHSPLLAQEEQALYESYRALRAAIS
jgi:hypothetical protein